MSYDTNIGGSKAKPPFNEMRQGFAPFKKETRMAPQLREYSRAF